MNQDTFFPLLVIAILLIIIAVITHVPINTSVTTDPLTTETSATVVMDYRKDTKGICYAYSTITSDRFTSVPCDKVGL